MQDKNSRLEKHNESLESSNTKLTKKCKGLKRKLTSIQKHFDDLQRELDNMKLKYNMPDNVSETLNQCADELPRELFLSTYKKAKGITVRDYHPAVRKFSMTLHLYSAKAYRFLRNNFTDVLPSERTLRH